MDLAAGLALDLAAGLALDFVAGFGFDFAIDRAGAGRETVFFVGVALTADFGLAAAGGFTLAADLALATGLDLAAGLGLTAGLGLATGLAFAAGFALTDFGAGLATGFGAGLATGFGLVAGTALAATAALAPGLAFGAAAALAAGFGFIAAGRDDRSGRRGRLRRRRSGRGWTRRSRSRDMRLGALHGRRYRFGWSRRGYGGLRFGLHCRRRNRAIGCRPGTSIADTDGLDHELGQLGVAFRRLRGLEAREGDDLLGVRVPVESNDRRLAQDRLDDASSSRPGSRRSGCRCGAGCSR